MLIGIEAKSQTYLTPMVGYDKAKLFTPEEEYDIDGGVYVLEEKFNSNGLAFGIKLSQVVYSRLGVSISYQYTKKLKSYILQLV